jgi:hypothetical protein
MKDIQTYQWIDLEESKPSCKSAPAASYGSTEIEVRVYNLGKTGEENAGKGVLAARYHGLRRRVSEPPQVQPQTLTSPRQTEFTAEEMYQERLMFHGPRFRGWQR